jgi:ubiquinone biosynthesis protein
VLREFTQFGRIARTGYVFAREGVFRELDLGEVRGPLKLGIRLLRLVERRKPSTAKGAPLAAALERLGPSYVKLGQFLATRPDVVGATIARDLETLQDKMAPFPQKIAETIVAEALDRPVAQLFTEFGPPVAAASIAQVHKAAVVDMGQTLPVAVKVLRPDVAKKFQRDLRTFYAIARQLERFSPPVRRLRPLAVVDTLARSVAFEMDLRLEAAALSEMGENTRNDPGFRVPGIDWARTAKDVLTLEWIDGIPLADHDRLRAAGHDLPALGVVLIQSFLRHAMRDGFFHADMHPGNLFVDAAGNIVAVDLGITGRLGPKEKRFLAEMLYGFIERDYRRVAEVHFRAGYVPADQSVEEFARALRSVGEPTHGRTAQEVSMARLLTQLFEITEIFNMQTRPELIMLQKTMVVVEGVARSLDPKLDMWTAADPVVREWITRYLGPIGKIEDAAQGMGELGLALTEVPELLQRTQRLASNLEDMTVRGFPLDAQSVRNIGEAEARRSRFGHLALWAIVGLLALFIVLR